MSWCFQNVNILEAPIKNYFPFIFQRLVCESGIKLLRQSHGINLCCLNGEKFMRNTSRKIDIDKTSYAGSLNVQVKLKANDEKVKEVKPYDDQSKYYREIQLYGKRIFCDRNGCELSIGGWASKTVVTALNTILAEKNYGDLKVKTINGELFLVRNNSERLPFFDGIKAESIYEASNE